MIISTFVDLQGFIVGKKFIMKEVAMLRKGVILSHFCMPHVMDILDKIRKILHFLVERLSSWITMGRWDDTAW